MIYKNNTLELSVFVKYDTLIINLPFVYLTFKLPFGIRIDKQFYIFKIGGILINKEKEFWKVNKVSIEFKSKLPSKPCIVWQGSLMYRKFLINDKFEIVSDCKEYIETGKMDLPVSINRDNIKEYKEQYFHKPWKWALEVIVEKDLIDKRVFLEVRNLYVKNYVNDVASVIDFYKKRKKLYKIIEKIKKEVQICA